LAGAITFVSVCNTAVKPPVKPLVFANFLAQNMTSVYTEVALSVGRALGRPAELIAAQSFDQLGDGSIDVAFLCGLPYIRLRREHPDMLHPLAAPVLDGARYQDRPVYFSDVIVCEDSPLRSFADLRGRNWAYNEPTSFSGYLLVRHYLLQMGETEAFFGSLVFSGSHQESLRRILNDEVDASAIDSHVLGVEQLRRPDLAGQIRVIAVLGPSTIPLAVATAGVSDEVQEGVRDALCALGRDRASRDVLGSGLIRRFTPIDDTAYDDIRRMTAAVESQERGNQLAGLGR
jgi:phosphonate transport system substrate-binding protein